jgi:hypothetical protein
MIGRTHPNQASRGFILAMLLGLFTVMGIFMTRAMPSVITEVQRDQEDELIYRGEAIRNGIRRYKAITGQFPTKLEDLMKVRPPILRRLYKDPMTREGDWDLVTQVQPGASGDKTGLPIVGVRSRSQKDSFKVYRGKTLYSDWVFSAADDLFGVQGSGMPQQTPPLDPNAGSSGRGGSSPQKGRSLPGGGTQ